jgi:hypothetical protein
MPYHGYLSRSDGQQDRMQFAVAHGNAHDYSELTFGADKIERLLRQTTSDLYL